MISTHFKLGFWLCIVLFLTVNSGKANGYSQTINYHESNYPDQSKNHYVNPHYSNYNRDNPSLYPNSNIDYHPSYRNRDQSRTGYHPTPNSNTHNNQYHPSQNRAYNVHYPSQNITRYPNSFPSHHQYNHPNSNTYSNGNYHPNSYSDQHGNNNPNYHQNGGYPSVHPNPNPYQPNQNNNYTVQQIPHHYPISYPHPQESNHPNNHPHPTGVYTATNPYYSNENRSFPVYHPSQTSNQYPNVQPNPNGKVTIHNKHTNKVKNIHNHYYYHNNDPNRQHHNSSSQSQNKAALPDRKILVSEEDVPAPKTICGRTLCPVTVAYPFAEITNAVDRLRQMFKSGISISSLANKGINLLHLNSKHDTFWYGKEAPDHRFVDTTNNCREHVSTSYPVEGQSLDDTNKYFVVNIPSLRQGLTNIDCESNHQMCGTGVGAPSSESKCRQMYREEELLVLPFGKRYFDVEDFQLRKFHVPTGCACIASA